MAHRAAQAGQDHWPHPGILGGGVHHRDHGPDALRQCGAARYEGLGVLGSKGRPRASLTANKWHRANRGHVRRPCQQ